MFQFGLQIWNMVDCSISLHVVYDRKALFQASDFSFFHYKGKSNGNVKLCLNNRKPVERHRV